GTVMVWDRGTWEPVGDPHKGYRQGNLKFTLKGKKLHGGWALVRIRGRQSGDDQGRSWLLIKERDKAARSGNSARVVDTRPKSVSTGRTLDQIAAAKGRVWHSSRNGSEAVPAKTRTPRARAVRGRRGARGGGPDGGSGARRAALPKLGPPGPAPPGHPPAEGRASRPDSELHGY